MLAPICLFTYNRLFETRLTVEALKQNSLACDSDLFIFSDGARNDQDKFKVGEVRNYLSTLGGFKSITIISSIENKGLADSIISGVDQTLEKYNTVIVLEDDLITSPYFLDFMNHALDYYMHEKRVQSINGYALKLQNNTQNIYFQRRPFPWGWATWRDRWKRDIFNKEDIKTIISTDKSILKEFKKTCGHDISRMLLKSINNKNDSWYVRWTFDHFRKNNYSVFPVNSYIQNIGHNWNATNCKVIDCYQSVLFSGDNSKIDFTSFNTPDRELQKDFLHYFTIRHKIMYRIQLLPSKSGRKLIIEDLKQRLGFQ
jgi:hypothetical protein